MLYYNLRDKDSAQLKTEKNCCEAKKELVVINSQLRYQGFSNN